ncbi:MAG: biopolymer transporter ExbD [Deltaproteobacteria bacterium]|nr:biopolymer transporter ExbD [Deltaproteobacteria bacterium]
MRRRTSVTPDINVTPLVDVVLVLLIIFMVVTPKMEPGKTVTLPKAQAVDQKTSVKITPTTLSVTAGGEIYFEDESVTDAVLGERLKTLKSSGTPARIVIKADERALYERTMAVFKTVQDQGFESASLQVVQKTSRAKERG